MRRLISVALLLSVACAHGQPRPVETVYPAPPPLSGEAAAFFALANASDTTGSIVVDFDEMRGHGLIGPAMEGRSPYVDILISGLAAGAPYFSEGDTGKTLTRAAVLIGLLRAWDAWPHVERVGIILPTLRPQALVMVFAVPGDAQTNAELLKGIAAIDRATGKPLFAAENGKFCTSLGEEVDSKYGKLCASSGAGYLLFSSSQNASAVAKAVPGQQPSMPSFFHLHANVPMFGRGDLVADWQAGIRLAADINTVQPEMAEKIEHAMNEFVQKLDENHAKTKANVEPVLNSAKQGLAKDPEAPPRLKQAAAGLTVENLLDPEGNYDAWRQSIHLARQDTNVTFSVNYPEPMVRRAIKQYDLLTATAVIGVLAAVAIPNFMKYQERAKQSEVRANLKAAYTAQKAYYQEKDHFGKTFDEIGFSPEHGNRYAYCMAGKCIPCTAENCYMPPDDQNKCIEMTREYANDDGSEGFLVCAIGDPSNKHDPEQMDIWTITEQDTAPQHVSGDSGNGD